MNTRIKLQIGVICREALVQFQAINKPINGDEKARVWAKTQVSQHLDYQALSMSQEGFSKEIIVPMMVELSNHVGPSAVVSAVPLALPAGVEGVVEVHGGCAMRALLVWDIYNSQDIIRFDILYWKPQ